jgi:hypothetical protein
MLYEQKFLLSLLLTLIIEIPLSVLLVRVFYKEKEIKTSKIVFAGIIASALTLPYFWFVLPFYIFNRGVYIFIGESAIVLFEAFIYYQFLQLKFSKVFIISLVANVVSALLGLIIL